jgi:hypothetical protein
VRGLTGCEDVLCLTPVAAAFAGQPAACRAVQNAQSCALAKLVCVRGTGGTSDCILWVRPLNGGQDGDGNPRLAKFVQSRFMIAASSCCGEVSALPKAAVGRSITYWISDAWAAP